MSYDVERIRALYPALQSSRVWLDGAAGTQSPTSVIEAIADTYRSGTSNGGGALRQQSSGRRDHRGCAVGCCRPGGSQSTRTASSSGRT